MGQASSGDGGSLDVKKPFKNDDGGFPTITTYPYSAANNKVRHTKKF